MMERKYLTVTALNRYLKFKFDNDENLQTILLKAEISNFKRHSRGHLYLTLKDDNSQISAIMFAGNTRSLKFEPKDGDKVIVEGYISVYEAYGTYQVYIRKMDIDGIGDLYIAYEELKARLEKEGLFAEEHKKPLPQFPRALGVITSPTGAAVRDIINVTRNRFPLTKIIVYPALVQGTDAKTSIVKQITAANEDDLVDLLIVGRGGGSIEDLWAFNEEIVARAVYSSRLPVISAVGHETDFTICDFVADKRASTPSHAAEIAVPNKRDIILNINKDSLRLTNALKRKYSDSLDKFRRVGASYILKNPLRIIETKELGFSHLYDKLLANSPKKLIESHLLETRNLSEKLNSTYRYLLQKKINSFINISEKLDLVNPLNILKKGFSITKKEGRILKSVDEVNVNDLIDITLNDGMIKASVKDKTKGNDNG